MISTKTAASPERCPNSTSSSVCLHYSCTLPSFSRIVQRPVILLPSPLSLQEMTDIMRSIYDMMGKYTYPNMRDSAPREHVDSFFQVNPLESYRNVKWINVSLLRLSWRFRGSRARGLGVEVGVRGSIWFFFSFIAYHTIAGPVLGQRRCAPWTSCRSITGQNLVSWLFILL